jgi:Domain of unknown function (DUF5664)
MTGRKDDGVTGGPVKARWDLVPYKAMASVVDVLTLGAVRYGPDNWQRVEPLEERYMAAMMRHVAAWAAGERVDPDSGLPHLAHVVTNALFLLSKEVGFDPPRSPS